MKTIMREIIFVLFVVLVVFSFTACDEGTGGGGDNITSASGLDNYLKNAKGGDSASNPLQILLVVDSLGGSSNNAGSIGRILRNHQKYVRLDLSECTFSKIDDEAFAGCIRLTGITLPDSITEIGNKAFINCMLDTVTVPEGVFRIGNNAFEDCKNLTEITIPDGVTVIGDQAFRYCTSLTNVIFPPSVTSIGSEAFASGVLDRSGLVSVTIPSGASIGHQAFRSCDKLTSVTFMGTAYFSNDEFPGFLFYDYDSYTETYYGYEKNGAGVYTRESGGTRWTKQSDIDIGSDVKTVTSAEELSAYLATVGGGSPENPIRVKLIVDDLGGGDRNTSGSIASIIWSSGVWFKYISLDLSQSTFTSIEDNTFSSCDKLVNVILPDTLVSIGDYAFSQTGITEVIIPDSVTHIGNNAFAFCTNLTNVIIGSGVTIINGSTFGGCGRLESINIPDNVIEIGNSAFWNCSSLASVNIGNGVTIIDNGAFQQCSSLTSITIPENVTYIGESAFSVCNNLTSVTFEGLITEDNFHDSAFSYSNLKTLYLDIVLGGTGTYTREPGGWVWTKQ